MPASYPNNVKVFTTKTTGQTILASHINEPQDEITAIEQGLLQGLAHALFPNTDTGQDLGTAARRWRQLLVQKIAAGITNATKLRIQEVGTSTWITVNADFDGTNWNREDTTQPVQAIEVNNNKEVKYYRAAAGTNPITWTNIFTISTDRITASQAVIGTDPGGTEVLRAQNLRAGPTTITSDLVVTGNVLQGARSDRGMIDFESDWDTYVDAGVYAVRQWPGTPVNAPPATYRYGILIVERFGAVGLTQIYIPHSPLFDPRIYIRQLWPNATWSPWQTYAALEDAVAKTIEGVSNPGGNIDLVPGANIGITADNVAKTITLSVSPQGAGSGLNADMVDGYHAGQAPLDTAEQFSQVVRCADFLIGSSTRRGSPGRALVDLVNELVVNFNSDWSGGTVIGGPVRTDSLVVGTDPGGTESLRAGSARLNAPVLLGSVPQFTMAADPTSPLQVATKQYVDSRPGGVIPDVRFLIQGNAVVANKVAQVLIGFGGTFTRLRAWADTAPAGSGLSIRINKNGVSVATLSIAAGTNSASTAVSIAVAAGDRISLDITGVGSTTPGGNDLLVTLHAEV